MKENTILKLLDKTKEGKIIKIKLEEITMLPELQNAFHMDSAVKDRITADMALNGFSRAHPIHIFMWEGKWVLCDGHTRFASAMDLKLKYVWAQVHTFNSINQALFYSMKEQLDRRNIEDRQVMMQYELLRQQEINGRKLTAAEMSERLKKSRRHIFKLQEVFSKSSKEDLQKIRDGLVSINHIYNEIKKKESQKDVITQLHDATSNISNEVKQNSIKKSEGVSTVNTGDKIQKKTQVKEMTDKQILLLGAQYALIQFSKGKTVAEILDTNNFEDSIKASEITFDKKEIDLLKAM